MNQSSKNLLPGCISVGITCQLESVAVFFLGALGHIMSISGTTVSLKTAGHLALFFFSKILDVHHMPVSSMFKVNHFISQSFGQILEQSEC